MVAYIVIDAERISHEGTIVSPGVPPFEHHIGIRAYAHSVVIGMVDPYFEDFVLSGGHVIECMSSIKDYDGIRGIVKNVAPTREIEIHIPEFAERFMVAKRMVESVIDFKKVMGSQDGDVDRYIAWDVVEGTDGEKRSTIESYEKIDKICKSLEPKDMRSGHGSAHFAARALFAGLLHKAHGNLEDAYSTMAEACVLAVRGHSKLLLHQVCEEVFREAL